MRRCVRVRWSAWPKPLRLMGADIATTDGKPPVTVRPAARPRGHRLRVAHGERAGEVRHPAGRSVRRRHHDRHRACAHARSHRAHAARLRRGHRIPAVRGAPRRRAETRRRHGSTCRATFPRRLSSWSRAVLRASTGFVVENVGINPTRTGVIDILRADGRGPAHPSDARGQGGEPVADIELRRSQLRGIRVPEAAGAAGHRRTARAVHRRGRRRRAKPSSPAPRSCA